MSGIVGSRLNTRGSGLVADLGTDGQVLTSAGAGQRIVYEDAAGGGTSWQSVVTASTLTAAAGNGYPINTTSNACTVTLPASASVGDTIEFCDYARTWETNNVTINPNSLNYQGATTPQPVYRHPGAAFKIVYLDATQGWAPQGVDQPIPDKTPQAYNIEWLVVGGGGSGAHGANGGGGGAGGYRTSTQSLAAGVTITVVVGDGGFGAREGGTGNNGSVSSITGTGLTTITSAGGGAGGSYAAPAAGGSGGGGGTSYQTGASGNTPSTSPSQGNNGGNNVLNGCGGGGGAGAVGGNGTAGSDGGPGGAGAANDITGSAVYYAGGGGGSHDSGSSEDEGGVGGGGHGARTGVAGSGQDFKGGGGGSAGEGGHGGIGVVIAAIPSDHFSEKVTGANIIRRNVNGTVVVEWHGAGTLIT